MDTLVKTRLRHGGGELGRELKFLSRFILLHLYLLLPELTLIGCYWTITSKIFTQQLFDLQTFN